MVSFLGVEHSDSDCEKLRAIGKSTTEFLRVLKLRSFVEGINEDAMLLGRLWHFFLLLSSSSLLLLVLAVHVTLTLIPCPTFPLSSSCIQIVPITLIYSQLHRILTFPINNQIDDTPNCEVYSLFVDQELELSASILVANLFLADSPS
jgi:hypothetical protein